jgi:mono/diheme cytochrome c family protein
MRFLRPLLLAAPFLVAALLISGLNTQAQDPAPAKELTPDEQIKIGQTYYAVSCLSCHKPNGLGVPAQYPPLAGSTYVNDPSEKPKQLVAIVLHGFIGPMSVNGQKFNNEMLPWGKQLSDEKIAAILTYVRQDWGNNAPPITAAAVAAIRAEFTSRKEQWTEKELQAIPASP